MTEGLSFRILDSFADDEQTCAEDFVAEADLLAEVDAIGEIVKLVESIDDRGDCVTFTAT